MRISGILGYANIEDHAAIISQLVVDVTAGFPKQKYRCFYHLQTVSISNRLRTQKNPLLY
jgi:hypothetical protein